MLGVKPIFLGCLLCTLSAEELPKDWASRIDPATLENSINIAQNENTDADVTPNNLFQGDIRVATASEGEFGEDSGITAGRPSGRLDPEKLWPGNGSDIPYNISASFTERETEMITLALNDITNQTSGCISFRPRSEEPAYIHFSKATTKKCSSQVGMQGGKQLIVLTSNCTESRGRIQHAILHSLGMLHEQSRPDRDEYVIIVKKHITTEMQIHFAKVPGMETHNTSYDVSSVMHFAFNEFSIDPKKPTIIPKRGFSGLKMGQREGISPLDAAKLKMLYSCQIDNDPEPDDETTLRPTAATKDREDGDLEATMDTVSTISQSHPDEGESSVDVSAEVDPSNLWPNGGKDIPYTFGRRFQWSDANDIMKTLAGITNQTSGCITFKLQENRALDRIKFSRRKLCDFGRRHKRRCRGGGSYRDRSFERDGRRYENDNGGRQKRRSGIQEEDWNTNSRGRSRGGWQIASLEGRWEGGREGDWEGGNGWGGRGRDWDDCEGEGFYGRPTSGRWRDQERGGWEDSERGVGRGNGEEEDGEGRNGGRRGRHPGRGAAEVQNGENIKGGRRGRRPGRGDDELDRGNVEEGPMESETQAGPRRSDKRLSKGRERFRRSSRSSCFATMEPVLRFVMEEIGVPMTLSPSDQYRRRSDSRFGQFDGSRRSDRFGSRGSPGSFEGDSPDSLEEAQSGVKLSKVHVARIKAAYGCNNESAAN